MGFDSLSSEAKKIDFSGKDNRKIIDYLLLHFHLENIENFVDLLCFREVLLLVKSDLSVRGFRLRNSLGEIVGKLVAYLNSQKFLEMDRIKLIFEKNFPGFIKEFITEVLQSEEPYIENKIEKNKSEMRKITGLFERIPKLRLEIDSENKGKNKPSFSRSRNIFELYRHIYDLLGHASRANNSPGYYHYAWVLLYNASGLLRTYNVLKFQFMCNERNGSNDMNDNYPVNLSYRLLNLCVEFDNVFFDKYHVIEFYLKQVHKTIYHTSPHLLVKTEIDALDRDSQVNFLSKCYENIFSMPLLRLISDYIASDLTPKGIKALMPSVNISSSVFSPKIPAESKEEHGDALASLSAVVNS